MNDPTLCQFELNGYILNDPLPAHLSIHNHFSRNMTLYQPFGNRVINLQTKIWTWTYTGKGSSIIKIVTSASNSSDWLPAWQPITWVGPITGPRGGHSPLSLGMRAMRGVKLITHCYTVIHDKIVTSASNSSDWLPLSCQPGSLSLESDQEQVLREVTLLYRDEGYEGGGGGNL